MHFCVGAWIKPPLPPNYFTISIILSAEHTLQNIIFIIPSPLYTLHYTLHYTFFIICSPTYTSPAHTLQYKTSKLTLSRIFPSIYTPHYTLLQYTFSSIHSPASTFSACITQYKTSPAYTLQNALLKKPSPFYILHYTITSIHFSSIHSPVYNLQYTFSSKKIPQRTLSTSIHSPGYTLYIFSPNF